MLQTTREAKKLASYWPIGTIFYPFPEFSGEPNLCIARERPALI
jgi:hypothetical protein